MHARHISWDLIELAPKKNVPNPHLVSRVFLCYKYRVVCCMCSLPTTSTTTTTTTTMTNVGDRERMQFLCDVVESILDEPLQAYKFTHKDAKTMLYNIMAREILEKIAMGVSEVVVVPKYHAGIFGTDNATVTPKCKMLLHDFTKKLNKFMHDNNCLDQDFTLVEELSVWSSSSNDLKVVLKWGHMYIRPDEEAAATRVAWKSEDEDEEEAEAAPVTKECVDAVLVYTSEAVRKTEEIAEKIALAICDIYQVTSADHTAKEYTAKELTEKLVEATQGIFMIAHAVRVAERLVGNIRENLPSKTQRSLSDFD